MSFMQQPISMRDFVYGSKNELSHWVLINHARMFAKLKFSKHFAKPQTDGTSAVKIVIVIRSSFFCFSRSPKYERNFLKRMKVCGTKLRNIRWNIILILPDSNWRAKRKCTWKYEVSLRIVTWNGPWNENRFLYGFILPEFNNSFTFYFKGGQQDLLRFFICVI